MKKLLIVATLSFFATGEALATVDGQGALKSAHVVNKMGCHLVSVRVFHGQTVGKYVSGGGHVTFRPSGAGWDVWITHDLRRVRHC